MAQTKKRGVFNTLGAATLALTSWAAPTLADTTELIFNVFIPPTAPLYTQGLEPWARAVEEASNGTLQLTIPTSTLAPPPRLFDIVQDGVADIAVSPLTFRQNQVGLDMIGGIPLISPLAASASAAAWDTHQTFFADAEEWDDLIPLTIFVLGAPAIISNAGPVTSSADLAGYKMLAVGEDRATIWGTLGAVPVGGSGQRPFEILSSGVAEGTTNPLGTAVTNGLLDASDAVTLVPGGMGGRAVFAIFVSRERFEDLPPEAQAALIDTSGTDLARHLGGIMDRIDVVGLNRFTEAGIAISDAPEEFVTEIRDAGAFVTDAWVTRANEAGIDGAAALAHFEAQVQAAQ